MVYDFAWKDNCVPFINSQVGLLLLLRKWHHCWRCATNNWRTKPGWAIQVFEAIVWTPAAGTRRRGLGLFAAKPDKTWSQLGFLPEAPPQQKTYKLLNTFPSCSLPNARQEIRPEELASSGQRRGDLGRVPTSSGSRDHRSPCRITRSGTGMKSSDSHLRSWSHVHVRGQFVLASVLNLELAAAQNHSRSRPERPL